jgi:hypothetical protein
MSFLGGSKGMEGVVRSLYGNEGTIKNLRQHIIIAAAAVYFVHFDFTRAYR